MSEETAIERQLRQYSVIFDLTTQILATNKVDERLRLSLEVVTTGLGFRQAAVALTDEGRAVLRMRMAAGFEDDEAIKRIETPLDAPAPHVAILSGGGPRWISAGDGEAAARFLAQLGCESEILALPLSRTRAQAKGGRPSIGALYVAADRDTIDRATLELLERFAPRIGLATSSVLHLERLAATIEPLERDRDRLYLIIENVGQPVAVCDSDGHFILFNARAERLFQQPDGSSRPGGGAAVRANADTLTTFIHALVADPRASVRQAEIELTNPQSGEKLPMAITAVEVTDAQGEVTAVVSILHDLSEIRELERRRVEQQLFESEKLAAVGRLAASIAHEVNNPLEAIKNSLYLLQTSTDQESNARFLEVARKETERVSHIIRQMLGFARRRGEVEWININQVLEETLILIEKKLRQSGVRTVRELDPQLPLVRARVDQLRQVFLNLILNAQQSIEAEGEITIRTVRSEQALQPSVAIEISDTGQGIGEDELSHIFEPFFSRRQKGTGLGLWVTQDIMRQHGGRIEVSSVKGRGTTFRIILPVDSPTLEQ